MNVFDAEFEVLTLIKELSSNAKSNEERLEKLNLLHNQQLLLIDLLSTTIKQLENDGKRTEKQIVELDAIIKNRSRRCDSYSRGFNQQEKEQ